MRTAQSVVWSAAALFLGVSCTHGTHVSQPPAPEARLTPQASAHPRLPAVVRVSSPAPTAPVVTPTPGATGAAIPAAPQIKKKVVRVSPDASPQILAVAISETTVAPGDKVVGRVVTSSNVASVQARIGGYAVNLAKVGVGRFALTYTVAPLPWFVRGNFTMQVIAKNTRGDAATRAIPLIVR